MTPRSQTRPKGPICLALVLAAAVGWLAAHDFWIEPAKFLVRPGETVAIRLLVGDHFQGEAFGRYASLIERFVVSGPDGEAETVGWEGSDPAGLARLDKPGLYAIGYRSKRSFTRLDAQAFENYIAGEGLQRISAERARLGESDRPVREAFSRCAKALVQVGQPAPEDEFPTLGLTLELTARRNPYRLKVGEDLPVRLVYQGKPLEDALVAALNQSEVGALQARRTNQDGEVSFQIDRPGLWMIKTVHMVRPPEDVDADWESLWASLTFDLPEARVE